MVGIDLIPYQNYESMGNFRGDQLVPSNVDKSSHNYAITVVILLLLLSLLGASSYRSITLISFPHLNSHKGTGQSTEAK